MLLIILYLILFHFHHVLCYLFVAEHGNELRPRHLCEPLYHVVYAFIEIPDPFPTVTQFRDEFNQLSNDIISARSEPHELCLDYPSILNAISAQLPCNGMDGFNASLNHFNVEFVILLSQRRGGSNYALDTLCHHPQIKECGHEITMRWFHHHCTQFVGDKESKCKSSEILSIISQWFVDTVIASNASCDGRHHQKKSVFVIKLQIEQFWTDHYRDFIHFVSCNNITIIHYLRGSTIGSYWSHAADSVERVQTGNPLKMLSRPRRNEKVQEHRTHIDSLWLDPMETRDYVMKIETLHSQSGWMFTHYPLHNIKYQRFYYENLIHPKLGTVYWSALQSFLGIDVVINGNESWMIREHATRHCFEKVENWEEVYEILNGTDSAFACQLMYS